MTRPIAFVDTETTSLDPATREAWEIAIIRRNPDGTESPRVAFVEVGLANADAMALSIGGFYQRHPVGQYISGRIPSEPTVGVDLLDCREAAGMVARWTHGCTIIGAQPSFDTITLTTLLQSVGLTPSWHYRLWCVESMTVGYLRREVGGLKACAEALGIAVDESREHQAMGDAIVAKAIYDRVMFPVSA